MKSAIIEAAEVLEAISPHLGTHPVISREEVEYRVLDLAQRLRAEAAPAVDVKAMNREICERDGHELGVAARPCLRCHEWFEPNFGRSPPAVNESLTTWRPIESAPKDGTQFIAVEGDYVGVCAWHKTSHIPMYGFHFHQCDPEDMEMCHPTHWMPLPAPPSAEDSSAVEKSSVIRAPQRGGR